ncbi:MAG TPA: adenylyltransferase, partial [Methanosarcinales archaeon]|nr:adenylyltransferase [Methanosarcinales archaeon]
MLGENESRRYERQMMLFGEGGQEKIRNAKVFIAGAGGLGSPISMYLAAAGVGRIRIVDYDTV